jgi:hypothetical protein
MRIHAHLTYVCKCMCVYVYPHMYLAPLSTILGRCFRSSSLTARSTVCLVTPSRIRQVSRLHTVTSMTACMLNVKYFSCKLVSLHSSSLKSSGSPMATSSPFLVTVTVTVTVYIGIRCHKRSHGSARKLGIRLADALPHDLQRQALHVV